jgi:hypothetical protein
VERVWARPGDWKAGRRWAGRTAEGSAFPPSGVCWEGNHGGGGGGASSGGRGLNSLD